MQVLASGQQPTGFELRKYPEDSRILFAQWDSLILQDGILYGKFYHSDGTTNFLQIILPVALHQSFVERLHADLGHVGQTKTSDFFAPCVFSWLAFLYPVVRSQLHCLQYV